MYWMLRPDSISAFEDDGVRRALGRYVQVSSNLKLAAFTIAKSIAVEGGLKNGEARWKLHDEAMAEFRRRKEELDAAEGMPELSPAKQSLLDLKRALAEEMLESCSFCERRCEVNRAKGERGFCNLDKGTRLSTEFLHMGEEACLVPSHTFFFIGCNFYCVFCQNWSISRQSEQGRPVTGKELAGLAKKRRVLEKSRNINLVGGEPTPNLHTILDMLARLDVNVPVVWNSNMYMSAEAMKLLDGAVDVYLADLKYGNDECAKRLSKVKDYWSTATRNHLLGKQHAELLIRHLVMPNHLECCTKPVLAWISEKLGNDVRVNIMGQYHPEFQALKYPELTRGVSSGEMSEALEFAREKGLWNLD